AGQTLARGAREVAAAGLAGLADRRADRQGRAQIAEEPRRAFEAARAGGARAHLRLAGQAIAEEAALAAKGARLARGSLGLAQPATRADAVARALELVLAVGAVGDRADPGGLRAHLGPRQLGLDGRAVVADDQRVQ